MDDKIIDELVTRAMQAVVGDRQILNEDEMKKVTWMVAALLTQQKTRDDA